MSSVYISAQAIDDLKDIFTSLISWSKGSLELNHALEYVTDIENQCYSLFIKPTTLEPAIPTINNLERKSLCIGENRKLFGISSTISILNRIF
jgi:hypothetical protein